MSANLYVLVTDAQLKKVLKRNPLVDTFAFTKLFIVWLLY